MKICPNCGHKNANDVSFCENCGTALASVQASQTDSSDDQKQCPRCRSMNPSASRFCENCGYDFELVSKQPKNVNSAPDETSTMETTHSNLSENEPKSGFSHTQEVPYKPVNQRHEANNESQTRNKRGYQWIVSAVLLILLIGGGGYLFYRDTGHTVKTSSNRTEKKISSHSQSSQSASSRASSQSKPEVNFDESAIEGDVTSTVGSLTGTNSVYVSPVDSKQMVLVNNGSQRSASSIKIFILVTAYAMAKEGVFNLDAMHTITDDEKVGGTGVIQNMDAGTKLTYREILKHMIDDSDNTGANIMIAKMGGFNLINNKIKSMGATNTKLRRKMMDTDAINDGRDNTTSVRDLGMTLKKIYNHQLVSKSADDEMLAILLENRNRSKLPKLLPSEVKVYNKTGEYADYGVQNDAEIVANKQGAFVAVVLSEDGEETDQISAMNQLGLKLYQNILE